MNPLHDPLLTAILRSSSGWGFIRGILVKYAFPTFLQDRHEVRTVIGTSGSPHGGRGSDLAIFAGIWTHGSRRLLLNP